MKKFVAAMLCLTLILGFVPPFSIDVRAADDVMYDPVMTEYAILNRFNYKDTGFYTAYVKSTNLFNAVGKFTGLAAGATYTRSSGTYS